MKPLALAALCLAALGACREEDRAAAPDPVPMTADALGHYCQMALAEHPGPKAQVHLRGVAAPIYFAQVRDAIAFQRMPEQSHAIAAIYVSDMAAAPSWDAPGAENWIAATDAHFVVGSRVVGGMGATELVPFSEETAAAAFAAEKGGQVSDLDSIPDSAVLAPAEDGENGTDREFIDRLNRISKERQG
ncbi:MAG: nitrous oxide reductase accessory protein NosL [Paracoccaceae bacterium]